MSTDNDNPPGIRMVPVKRYDVTLTLDDILTPLTKTASNLTQAGLVAAADAETAQHLQKFTDLVTQLQDVVSHLNQINPNLLASKAGPPPGA